MKIIKILAIVFICLTDKWLVMCWKPIVGTTYSRVTHHHPVVGTQNTIIDSSSDIVSGSENSASFHGKASILNGIGSSLNSGGSEDILGSSETIIGTDGTHLTVDQPVLGIEQDTQLDDTEGRVLSAGISSEYDRKILNGFLSSTAVSD